MFTDHDADCGRHDIFEKTTKHAIFVLSAPQPLKLVEKMLVSLESRDYMLYFDI